MKKLKTGISLFGLLVVAGCASQPEEMQRAYVSPNQYASLTCTQLGSEMERVSARRVELYTQLKKTADDDAVQMGVGLILLWPTLFFLEGGDGPQATEYSRLLGEQDAIEKTMVSKDCTAELQKAKQDISAEGTVEERLKKLQKLRDDGIITQPEYDTQRTKILNNI